MEIKQGDVTKISTDAIVNAANTELKHAGGVALAIVKAGGGTIQKESDNISWCDIGKASVTGAGRLPAKIVIHVPTIDYTNSKKATIGDIRKGVLAALEIAVNTNCKRVNFPLLGAGVVGLPIIDVAGAMKEAADTNPEIQSTLVVFNQSDFAETKNIFG